MKTASDIRRLDTDGSRVVVHFQGEQLCLRDGANLAAELLAAGVNRFRHTPVTGSPRGPFCMMGGCFDCLVEIDGVTRQACMTTVHAGMEIAMPATRGPDDA